MDLIAESQKNISQFKTGFFKVRESIDFIRKHQLWNGLDRYGWLSKLLIVVAILLGLSFIKIVVNWWDKSDASSIYAASQSVGMLAMDIFNEGFLPIFTSGSNYLLLALVEVLVFHFSRRTLEILTKKAGETAFKDFINAQKRMIKVMFFAWIAGMVIEVILSIVFGIFEFLSFLQSPLSLVVEIYFLGFAILDNYNEQFGLKVKESFKYLQDYMGLVLSIGLIVYLLIQVPIFGPIVAPIVAAVAGTLAMYELADLHKRKKSQKINPEDLVIE